MKEGTDEEYSELDSAGELEDFGNELDFASPDDMLSILQNPDPILDVDGKEYVSLSYSTTLISLVLANSKFELMDLESKLSASENDRLQLSQRISKIDQIHEMLNKLQQNSDSNRDPLSHDDAAKMLHISTSTLYKWHEKGIIRGAKINGGKLVWSKEILEKLIKDENGMALLKTGHSKLKDKINVAENKLGLNKTRSIINAL